MAMAKDSLKGKKLLILGGGSDIVTVTKCAQRLGCIVYITDYYDTKRSPAKLVADEYASISITDYEAVVEYIKENEIDGVLTGFTDSYLQHYMKICEMAELPYYGSAQAFGIATDKMLFKEACEKAGVGVIPGTHARDFAAVENFALENGYPIMLKPTDNSGSRGVIKCESEDKLRECFEYALSYSESGNVIVERFMDCDSVGVVYQLTKDEAKLVALCDRDVYHADVNGSAIVEGTRYPSKYLERYINEVDQNMRKCLKENGFSEGMVSPMAFVDSKGFYMCEMCYRPSGGHHFTLIDDQNDVNGLELLIEFAVTGKTESYNPEKETPYFKEVCGMVHIIGKAGAEIASVSGVSDIEKAEGVIDVCQKLREGQVIGKDGTTAQVLLSVWLKAENWEKYDAKIDEIKSLLKVYDKDGNLLLN